jgi:hypothetical protein
MAGLQERNGSFRLIFRFGGKQRSVTLGRISPEEAEARAGAADLLLLRIKQGLITLPPGVSIEEFILADGRAPAPEAAGEKASGPVKLSAFADRYAEARSGGSMEPGSLATARMHLRHFQRTLGNDFDLRTLSLADLQNHVDKRRKQGDPRRKKEEPRTLSSATLRLEVSTLRSA